MEALIRDLLSYSRTVYEDSEVQSADLNVALQQALEILENRIKDTAAIVNAGELPSVQGDPIQVALVFQNLISNALKYRKRGQIPHISISGERSGAAWVIAVRDNGIGFEPQYAARIFGLFKRLQKDAYPGTGLGLAICKRIVERFGGRIWAQSEPGQGSTFYFSLLAQ